MRLILMILMAVDEPEHERELSLNIPTKQLGSISPDLPVDGEKVVQGGGQRKNQGMAAERPPEVISEYASGGEDTGEDMHGTVQQGKSGGECRCIRCLLVRINSHQWRTETGRTGPLELQRLSSTSQRVPPRHLVPSKLS